MCFSMRLANGKEASFSNGYDLAMWYRREKQAAMSVEELKKQQQEEQRKEEQK